MRRSRIGTLSLLLLAGSTLAGGLVGDRVLAGGSRLNEHLRNYTAALAVVEGQYVEDVEPERLVTSSIREMLRTLDPHSNFLEMREYSTLQERQRGSYFGLGITVQSIDGAITVVSPFEGTPAFRLGIRAGDVIVKIEDEDARGLSIDDAVKRLRGPKGSPVRVTIQRPGYEEPLEFTVIRDEIPLHSVPYAFMLDEHTGYVRLQDFNETTACRPGEPEDCERELEKALHELGDKGARAVVLDIRDNPGGLLDQAFAVTNLFLRKGQLVVFTRGRYKRDESNYITEQESPWVNLPLIVLVSRHSASASEIVAGAIQDHDRGLIVGETTFGKGLVQTIMPLRNVRGYALALTTARYYTPSGRSIQRDYGQTALEDYVAPRDRAACESGQGEAKLTDAGRRVFGGDGITPDYCVEPETPTKFVSTLIGHRAFVGFSGEFESEENAGAVQIAGTGSRAEANARHTRLIGRDFKVDDAVFEQFKAYLEREKIPYTEEELASNHDEVAHEILEEVLRQTYGEGEARRRSWHRDPQLQRALALVPQAELLLRDPKAFIAEHAAETAPPGGTD
jgi:carboxyl-terminal processing protease